MKYNFTGFTEMANRALNLAIDTAERFGHTYIGSEHILLGLSKENAGAAAAILREKGITPDRLEKLLAEAVGRGTPTSLTPDRLTPRAKRVLELAMAGARSLGVPQVGTEHILTAILEEGDNYAVRFLSDLGADPGQIMQAALKVMGAEEKAANAPSAAEKMCIRDSSYPIRPNKIRIPLRTPGMVSGFCFSCAMFCYGKGGYR